MCLLGHEYNIDRGTEKRLKFYVTNGSSSFDMIYYPCKSSEKERERNVGSRKQEFQFYTQYY